MLKNNLKVFLRVLIKNPLFSLINVLGLVLAFTLSSLIYLHINHEMSYDSFHERSEDIHRVAWMSDNPQTRTPHPMAQAMKNDFPEVEAAVSLSPVYGPGLTKTTTRFVNKENNIVFDEPEGYLVDTTFFDVFSFEFISGDPTVLEKVGGLLISESMAKRFYGEEDPIGKFLAYGNEELPLEVVAVLKDPPLNSHFRFNFIVSYVTTKSLNPNQGWFQWGDFGHFNYVKLSSGVDKKDLERRMPQWLLKYLPPRNEEARNSYRRMEAGEIGFALQPIESIHLESHLRWELDANSDYSYIYIYGISGVFILLISVINFVNLSTARSIERLKEIGVRKTLGAFKGQLFRQFLFESVAFVFTSLMASIGLMVMVLPAFNALVKGQISETMVWSSGLLIPLFMIALVIAALAAFYPSIYLNSIDPGKILKGMSPNSLKGGVARNLLLGIQFFMSVLLISGSLFIHDQISFLKEKELGFDKENLLVVRIKEDDEIVPRLKAFKSRLYEDPNIQNVTAVSNIPGGQFNYNPSYWDQDELNSVLIGEFLVDYDVFETLDLEIVKGRKFDQSYASDSAGVNYIINETAARNYNLEDPLGKRIFYDDDDRMKPGTIVGVVKDFHFKSLHEAIKPIIMQIYPDDYNFLMIKTQGADLERTVNHIQEVYNSYDPLNSFEYYFLDGRIEELYKEESRTLDLVSLFSVISIFLSVAGLIGVALMVLRKRIKEIGIRKVLGASVAQILLLLNLKYLKIAVVSLLVAIPSTYYFIAGWLNNFTYQTPMNPLIFLITATGILGTILLTISVLSLKTSRSNPTRALRYE